MNDYKEKWESLWGIYKRMKDDGDKQIKELQTLAADRLELLREIEEWVVVCPICLIRLKDHPFEHHKKADEHSDTCKLARELDKRDYIYKCERCGDEIPKLDFLPFINGTLFHDSLPQRADDEGRPYPCGPVKKTLKEAKELSNGCR